MIDRRRFALGVLATATTSALPLVSHAETYPARPIKWIVPFLPGTSPDVTARILAEAVGPLIGQTVVVENRAGAGGNLGARLAMGSPADGYTWVYSSAPMAANMRMYAQPGYDALKDFRHVMRLTNSDTTLIVPGDSDIRSFADFVKVLRAKDGQVDYASGGVGTPSHLGVEMLLSATGLKAQHVPYKGASEIVNAVMTKQVTFGIPISSVSLAQVKSGKLRALAVTGSKRNATLPEVPTLAELGVKNAEIVSWGGISVPVKTPDDVVAKIRTAFHAAMKQPKTIEALLARGGQIDVMDTEAFTKGFTAEIEMTEAMMKRVQLSPM